jgi:hypothetical protein
MKNINREVEEVYYAEYEGVALFLLYFFYLFDFAVNYKVLGLTARDMKAALCSYTPSSAANRRFDSALR